MKVAGAAGALAFGLLTVGAADAEAAQGGFMSATGRSREEAVAFVRDMNGLAGTAATVGVGFDKIAATGTEVARQFELTGEAGAKMTEDFLAFAKVTGQDAVQAVEGLDGTLDAFHLPAERATSLMDQFIASNQKYGTDIGPATIEQLNKMAPALQAMGMDIDDGLGLLNLFEQAGLDAAGATRGLNSAIENIPPGDSLHDVLARIQAIADPLERAQAATEIFGAKAGTGLANALAPGGLALDDYIITTDEATGHLDDASEAMVTTGDRFRMVADKILAGARDIGQQFGPLITGLGSLASLGAPFAKGLIGMFTGLLRHAGILGAATAVGGATGGAEATGHTAASTGPTALRGFLSKFGLMTAPKVIAATAAGTSVGLAEGNAAATAATGPSVLGKWKSGFAAMGPAIGATLGVAIGVAAVDAANKEIVKRASEATAMLSELRAQGAFTPEQEQQVQAMGGYFEHLANAAGLVAPVFREGSTALGDFGTEMTGVSSAIQEIPPAIADSVDRIPPIIDEAAQRTNWASLVPDLAPTITANVTQAVHASSAELRGVYPELFGGMTPALEGGLVEVHRLAAWGGAQTPREFSQGARSGFDSVSSAFGDLRQLMKDTLSPVQQEAELIGIATSKRLANALDDRRPEVRGEAQQIALDTIAQLHAIDKKSPEIGRLTTLLLARALPQERPALQDAINKIVNTVTTPLGTLPSVADRAGEQIALSLARGITDRARAVRDATSGLANIVKRGLLLESPAKEGPWSEKGGPLAWMERAGKGISNHFADSILAAIPGVEQARDALTGAFMPSLDFPHLGLPSLNLAPVMVGGFPTPSPFAAAGSPSAGAASPGREGDQVINIQPKIYGLPLRADTPLEVVNGLRRAVRMGEIAPPRADRWRTPDAD